MINSRNIREIFVAIGNYIKRITTFNHNNNNNKKEA